LTRGQVSAITPAALFDMKNDGNLTSAPKPPLYLDFCDFGTQINKQDNFYTNLLAERYDVRIADQPDFLLHSHDGNVHRLYTCKKIFQTVESYRPDLTLSDYSITHHELHNPRNLRLPNYAMRYDPQDLVKRENEGAALFPEKNRFCCFFTSYASAKTRIRTDFFQRLSRYRQVDSAGKYMNNIGRTIPFSLEAKIAFMRPYKFFMAFENQSLPDYTTEKIVDGMMARCIPIYWGNPEVAREFNPRSFLNYHDFPNEDALIERIIEIDTHDDLYLEYLNQPFFHDNRPNIYFDRTRMLDFFTRIIQDPSPPVAARKSLFRPGRWRLLKRNKPHRIAVTEAGAISSAGPQEMSTPAA
jgi:alpha(1,3/1,4) fucosyltransferase